MFFLIKVWVVLSICFVPFMLLVGFAQMAMNPPKESRYSPPLPRPAEIDPMSERIGNAIVWGIESFRYACAILLLLAPVAIAGAVGYRAIWGY